MVSKSIDSVFFHDHATYHLVNIEVDVSLMMYVCFIAAVGLIDDADDPLSSEYSIDQQQITTDVQIMNNSG